MQNIFISSLLLLAISLNSCKNGQVPSEQNEGTVPNITGQNPETANPNTEIKPAFKGQTRIAGVSTSQPYNVDILNDKLGSPWAIIELPDSRLLITEKSGFMQIVSNDGKTISKIQGLPKVDTQSQGGLLDVAIDPSFATNRMIYWTFSEPYSQGNHTAVAKGKLSADEKTIENPTVIFRATPTYNGKLHYGSRIVFDKSGNMFISTGERSDLQTRPLAQDQSTYLGKVLYITKEGKPAVTQSSPAGWNPEIYSTGHRNPQGLAIHPVTGDLWESEMGPRGGDEINLIKSGKNYGWPTITYGEEYSGNTIGEGIGQKDGLEQPVYYWDPSVSTSGIDFYTGDIDEWKNNLMVGCLSGEKIIRLVIENNKVVGEEWLLTSYGERFRDVLSASDGNLYAVTDSGKLFRVSIK